MPLRRPKDNASIDLHDRVVLITGATGGLGKPLSLACGAAGATVVLHGRVVRKLEALYDEIKQAGHPEPIILPLDLAKAGADDFANVTSALEAQLSQVSNRLNVIMKQLTSWAGIVLVPTLIAGIYGMNFLHMPELHWKYGYAYALGLMALSMVVLYRVFKKRDWL